MDTHIVVGKKCEDLLNTINVHKKAYITEEALNNQVNKITQLVDISLCSRPLQCWHMDT